MALGIFDNRRRFFNLGPHLRLVLLGDEIVTQFIRLPRLIPWLFVDYFADRRSGHCFDWLRSDLSIHVDHLRKCASRLSTSRHDKCKQLG